MFISNELKVLNPKGYNADIRINFIEIFNYMISNIIESKPMFQIENFEYIYFDEFALKTNCHEPIFNTLYVNINQPNNYKLKKISSKKKSDKIKMPELYTDLDAFILEIYNHLLQTLDSNNIVWHDNHSVYFKSIVCQEDGKQEDYYFQIVPAITHYSQNNIKGLMYKKNSGIEIEYVSKALENFNKKNEETKDLYRQTVLIFKNILLKEKDIETLPSEIIETLLYNVPNKIFKDDSLDTMIAIINYLRNNSINKFTTIDEQDLAFTSIYRSMSIYYCKHIIKLIEKYLLKNM